MKIGYKAVSWLVSANCAVRFLNTFMVAYQLIFFVQKSMKTKAIVAGLMAVAAAMTTYFIIRRRNRKPLEPIQRTHHLTDVFSKAKSYAK
jgi:hypothetical protein